jgi:hypothetical protein
METGYAICEVGAEAKEKIADLRILTGCVLCEVRAEADDTGSDINSLA